MEHFLHCQKNATLLSYPKHLLPQPDAFLSTDRIKTCAVIGAGVMGQGIALCFLQAGFKTILLDKDEQSVASGLSLLWETVRKSINRQQMDGKIIKLMSDNLTYGTDLNVLKNADFVVEAVYEDMGLKKELFKNLDNLCKADALLCTNTSTLDISAMAQSTTRPKTVVGMHFFNPAHANTLIEVIYSNETDARALNTVVQLAKRIGKVPVIVDNAPGFCGNRMCRPYYFEALNLVAQGVAPQVVDELLKRMGFAIGPFQTHDLIGLDTMSRINKTNDWKLNPIVDTLCKLNRYGRKSGKGWYLYKDGRRQVDPELQTILQQHHSIKLHTTLNNPQEVIKILLYPMINEAFKIMEEQVVVAPEAIDLIWLLGYGWPLDKGGPMYFAEKEGLQEIVHFLKEKAKSNTELYWQPCDFLQKLANGKIPYSDWGSNIPTSAKL